VLGNELKKTGVVAESGGQVTNIWSGNGGFEWTGKLAGTEAQFGTLTITPEYGKTVGFQWEEGRDFSRDYPSDSSALVINEADAHYMGLAHPVGEIVHWKIATPLAYYLMHRWLQQYAYRTPLSWGYLPPLPW
jgi:putative ABC transport system permease protein